MIKALKFGTIPPSFVSVIRRTARFDANHSYGDGLHGYYFKLGRGLGAKVFWYVSDAHTEWKILCMLRDKGVKSAPKPYAMKTVLCKGMRGRCKVIFMEHVYGKKYDPYQYNPYSCEDTLKRKADELNSILESHGVFHLDLHDENMFRTNKGRLRVIDFSLSEL